MKHSPDQEVNINIEYIVKIEIPSSRFGKVFVVKYFLEMFEIKTNCAVSIEQCVQIEMNISPLSDMYSLYQDICSHRQNPKFNMCQLNMKTTFTGIYILTNEELRTTFLYRFNEYRLTIPLGLNPMDSTLGNCRRTVFKLSISIPAIVATAAKVRKCQVINVHVTFFFLDTFESIFT